MISPTNGNNQKEIEYDDVYVVEERSVRMDELDPNLVEEDKDNLTLDSMDLSDEESVDALTSDYDKLKLASLLSKRKMEREGKKGDKGAIAAEFQAKVVKREEVVEDFIRNYFTQNNLPKTLDQFNKEFNELAKKGKFNDNYLGPITDVHIKNAKLEEKLTKMMKELDTAKKKAEEAKSKWERLRKERDFHKENYLKTVSEKAKMSDDIKTLHKLHEDFQSKISDLKLKYEHLCKSRSLMKLESEKLYEEKRKIDNEIVKINEELNRADLKSKSQDADNKINVLPYKQNRPGEKTPWPKDVRNNLYLMQTNAPLTATPVLSGKTIKAYEKSAACMAVHIKKNVVATGGDDAVFKIFDMARCEELCSGTGHSEYISGIDIHPKGTYLATSSGDHTVKLWDCMNLKVKKTFDHHSVVWGTKFHDTGDFLLTCAEDGGIKLFDLTILDVRATYPGHTDSVNKVNFQPFTNYFASCSADKSISIWDMRLGLTVQTFYGHLNSINDVIFNPKGDMLYSCDADGIIKSWDIRTVSEMNTWVHYPHCSATCLEVDKSNSVLYVGHENGFLGIVNLTRNALGNKIKGHDGPINGIGINLTNTNMFSVGSDGALNVWQ